MNPRRPIGWARLAYYLGAGGTAAANLFYFWTLLRIVRTRAPSGRELFNVLALGMTTAAVLLLARTIVAVVERHAPEMAPVRRGGEFRVPLYGAPVGGALATGFLLGMVLVLGCLLLWDLAPPRGGAGLALGIWSVATLADFLRRSRRRARGADAVVVRPAEGVIVIPRGETKDGQGRRLSAKEVERADIEIVEGPPDDDNRPTTLCHAVLVLRSGERIRLGRRSHRVYAAAINDGLRRGLAELGVEVCRSAP